MAYLHHDYSYGNRFVELKHDNNRLHVRWGRIDTEGQNKSFEFDDAETAGHEYQRQLAALLCKGYRYYGRRNDDMIQAIANNPDDQALYLVYGDWLQTQGDSRGKLIVTQYQLSLDPNNQMLIKNESKLFQNNKWVEPWWQKQVECHWRLGFIHQAFYDMRGDETAGGWIRRMLQNPSFRFLRRLMIYNISPFGHQQLVRLLSESLPGTVSQLELFGVAKHSISKDAEIRRVPTLKIYSQPSPTSKQKSLW